MRRFGLLFAAFIAALALVGCAGGDDEATTTTETAQGVGAISFVIDRELQAVTNIYTIDPDGGDLRLLVGDAEAPVWSSDGRLLSYYGTETGRISVLDVAGDKTRRVPGDLVSYSQMATFSPGGERLAFVGDNGIWTMPVSGGSPKQLTFEQEDDYPQWSPDGRRIAFRRLRQHDFELWIVEADGKQARRLAPVPITYLWSTLAWSPDGRRLAFADDDDHLQVVDVESGTLSTVAPEMNAAYAQPAWSPDATQLAFEGSHRWGGPDGTYVVHLASGALWRILDSGDYSAPSWSPDGSRLAVSVNDELWLVRADGTGKRRLVFAGNRSSIEDAQWHPGALRSSALGGKPATTRAPVVHVNALGDTYSACGIELWRPEGSRWLVAGEGNTGRAYAKPLRPGVWQILDDNRDVMGQAVATNSKRTRWKITDARGTLVGTAQSSDGAWIALVLLWGGADCFD